MVRFWELAVSLNATFIRDFYKPPQLRDVRFLHVLVVSVFGVFNCQSGDFGNLLRPSAYPSAGALFTSPPAIFSLLLKTKALLQIDARVTPG